MRKSITAVVLATSAAMLTACTGTGDAKSGGDVDACRKAVTAQVKKSMAGGKEAKSGSMPASCEGLSDAAKKKIADKVIADVVGDALGDAVDDSKPASPKADPAKDVKITSCATDESGYPVAKVEVTNSGSATVDTDAQVVFNAPDGTRLADGYALVNALEAGGKAKEQAMGLKDVEGEFVCKLGKVDRWQSN